MYQNIHPKNRIRIYYLTESKPLLALELKMRCMAIFVDCDNLVRNPEGWALSQFMSSSWDEGRRHAFIQKKMYNYDFVHIGLHVLR